MNTKYLMVASAVFTGLLGLAASFLPAEILKFLVVTPNALLNLLVQITGALYLGFAFMNWMAKSVLIGCIYAKPLAMGNFLHFTVAALALLKFIFSQQTLFYIWAITLLYAGFALLFGRVLFTKAKVSKS